MGNKKALVTGASRGIGRAIALELAKQGSDIIVHYNKSKAEANQVCEEIKRLGVDVFLVQADLTVEDEVVEVFKAIETYTDRLDTVVNNAGFDHAKMIEEFTLDEMRYILDIILVSKMAVTKKALPLLKKSDSPSIINISSRMGREKTIKTIGAYGPAQAGVMKFTQCCALEFAPYGIRVNCVAPGLTETDLTRNILSRDDFDLAATSNPRGRVGQPEDIAKVVRFLTSEDAGYINGEILGVNGGSNLG